MHPYSVTLPRTIFSGVNALDNLHQIARNSHKIAIFTDTIIMNLGLVDQITDILNQASAETMIISDLPSGMFSDVWTYSTHSVQT